MTNQQILQIAIQQSAYDINADASDFLPDVSVLKRIPCKYEMRIMEKKDFENFYLPEWSNAL